jgi:hypothetical protein
MMTTMKIPTTALLIVAVAVTVTVATLGGTGRAAENAAGWMSRPAVPAALAVPETAKLAVHLHATGAQIYTCLAAPGATAYAWTLLKPDATLFDQKGIAVGTHGAGPTWTAKDGSSVVAKKVAQADAPAADAVAWLLLRADKSSDRGLFSHVTYVQRVGTKKGKPPAATCDAGAAKTEARADYSAEYYFYVGGDPG